jgi:hypothetical protein
LSDTSIDSPGSTLSRTFSVAVAACEMSGLVTVTLSSSAGVPAPADDTTVRAMGHLETGDDSISDPLMGGLV